MILKKAATVFVALLMLASPAIAQEAQMETEARLNANAGTTPDSILYGLDRAFERVSLALSTNANARAMKHLEQSEERLAEMEAMARANKSTEARAAAEDYRRSSERAAEESSEADAETRTDVDARLQTHTEVLQDLLTRFQNEGIAGEVGISIALEASSGARGDIAIAAREAGDGTGVEAGAEAGAETGTGSAEAGVNASASGPPAP